MTTRSKDTPHKPTLPAVLPPPIATDTTPLRTKVITTPLAAHGLATAVRAETGRATEKVDGQRRAPGVAGPRARAGETRPINTTPRGMVPTVRPPPPTQVEAGIGATIDIVPVVRGHVLPMRSRKAAGALPVSTSCEPSRAEVPTAPVDAGSQGGGPEAAPPPFPRRVANVPGAVLPPTPTTATPVPGTTVPPVIRVRTEQVLATHLTRAVREPVPRPVLYAKAASSSRLRGAAPKAVPVILQLPLTPRHRPRVGGNGPVGGAPSSRIATAGRVAARPVAPAGAAAVLLAVPRAALRVDRGQAGPTCPMPPVGAGVIAGDGKAPAAARAGPKPLKEGRRIEVPTAPG